MQEPPFFGGFVLVGLATAVAFITALAIGLWWPGVRRAGLLAGALPLGLLLPAVATAYASQQLINVFAGMAQAGSGGARAVLDACASLWVLQRVAWGGFAVLCVAGFLIGLLRFGPSGNGVPCSARRGLLLSLLPVLGLLVAGSVAHQLGKAMRVSAAVVSSDHKNPASEQTSEAALAAEGLGGGASIAAISGFIARAMMIGLFGGMAAVIVLIGLALPGFILAWRVSFGTRFVVLASALWLLAAVGAGLLSLGVVDPLRLS